MYIINPKEFTQMIKKKFIQKKSEKKKKTIKENIEQEKNQWNYLNFAKVVVTQCTYVLNNPVKDRGIVLNEDMYKRPIKFKGTNKLESEIIGG